MSRVWVFQTMVDDSTLSTLVGGRFSQATKLDRAPHEKPFVVYRQTSDIDWTRGDDADACRKAGYMIFAHDIPGDYIQIYTMIGHFQRLFKDTRDPTNSIVRSRWVETSEDFRDDDMGTIVKYGRIEVIYRV